MMEMNEMTKYLMLVASSIDNYCKYLNKDVNDYSTILGYVYRVYQDKIRKVSPQGIGLIMIYLKEIDEKDYEKYIDAYKDKVDDIIKNSKTLDEQFAKMDKIKSKIDKKTTKE